MRSVDFLKYLHRWKRGPEFNEICPLCPIYNKKTIQTVESMICIRIDSTSVFFLFVFFFGDIIETFFCPFPHSNSDVYEAIYFILKRIYVHSQTCFKSIFAFLDQRMNNLINLWCESTKANFHIQSLYV